MQGDNDRPPDRLWLDRQHLCVECAARTGGKGVTHELVDVPFGAHREQPHLSRQPFAKVPGFEHDGFALYETQAIMRYVDERFRSKSAGARSRGCASTSTEHKDALEGVPALYPGS